MRSVFVYLKEPKTIEIVSLLDNICSNRNGSGEAWLWLKNDDLVLYIEFYEERFWAEIEPKEWKGLVKKLGSEPELCICVNVSGRHPGKDELFNFLEQLLVKFDGVVLDDYTDYAWEINEILNGKLVKGHPFFDYVGWNDDQKESLKLKSGRSDPND